jgi:hypothetical protein
MRTLSLIVSVIVGLSSTGCAAIAHKKKPTKPILIAETIETSPEGYFIKDKKGGVWLLTVSPDGRIVTRKVPAQ